MSRLIAVALVPLLAAGCATPRREAATERYDLLIRNGLVYDGSGTSPKRVEVAVRGDRVAALLPAGTAAEAAHVIDAQGHAVSPGFINVLSWATESLIVDGRGMSDTKQGVTLEVFGEGWSMGPLNPAMKANEIKQQGDLQYPIEWTTLGEYLDFLEKRGVTPNVASFVGAATVRMHELGERDVAPDAAQLARMQTLVREAMGEGALGVGASLIYVPGTFAKTDELIALAQTAADASGGYVAHMRNEDATLIEALDETLAIARATGQHAEVYHLKAAGKANWPKMTQAIASINAARAAGVDISANMYAYPASSNGLAAELPTWVREGGHDEMIARLKNPATRARALAEMKQEKLRLGDSGWAGRVLLIGFKSDRLRPLIGTTLQAVAQQRGSAPEDTVIDLIVEDDSNISRVTFSMSEDNVELGLKQPWVSLGSDAGSSAPEGVFLKSSTHPRAYGNFARFLGHYVRDRKLMSLQEAIRRITRLPAQNWKLRDRGCLDVGCHADIVVFDPATIRDHATFEQPMQYATGVSDVFVNGVQVLRDGEHTGAKPGRVVRGPGWTGWE